MERKEEEEKKSAERQAKQESIDFNIKEREKRIKESESRV